MILFNDSAVSSTLYENGVIFNTEEVVVLVQAVEHLLVISFEVLFGTYVHGDSSYGLFLSFILTIVRKGDLLQINLQVSLSKIIVFNCSLWICTTTFPDF